MLLAGACSPNAPGGLPSWLPGADERSPFAAAFALSGTWEWAHVVDDPGLRRLEREVWRWQPATTPGVLRGAYLREVTVRSATLPFSCNQARQYQQRAWFEVEARIVPPRPPRPPPPPAAAATAGAAEPDEATAAEGELEIVEKSYRAEPSPCDHGFRKLGRYRAFAHGGHVVLHFPEGRQTLWRTAAAEATAAHPAAAPRPPWERAPAPLGGAWRWSSRSTDEQGLVRREEERWELAVTSAFTPCVSCGFGAFALLAEHAVLFDGVYTRRVTVESADGAELPCAGAAAYGFEDRFVVEGRRRGALIALRETAVAAAPHPCLQDRDERSLDSATLEQLGDHLLLDWRGKRRQVLHRPR